jgi:glutathione peroxidase-family protein
VDPVDSEENALIHRNGEVVARFAPEVTSDSQLVAVIETELARNA